MIQHSRPLIGRGLGRPGRSVVRHALLNVLLYLVRLVIRQDLSRGPISVPCKLGTPRLSDKVSDVAGRPPLNSALAGSRHRVVGFILSPCSRPVSLLVTCVSSWQNTIKRRLSQYRGERTSHPTDSARVAEVPGMAIEGGSMKTHSRTTWVSKPPSAACG